MSKITQSKLSRAKVVQKTIFIKGEKKFRQSIVSYDKPLDRKGLVNPNNENQFVLASEGQRINFRKLRNKIIYKQK